MHFKKDLGIFGEFKACEYLKKNNYKIIERNFVCRQGEIDIIALSQKKELIFIEVKTRQNLKYGRPCEAVTHQKRMKILLCSKYYIMLHNLYNIPVMYDVIEVLVNSNTYTVNHLKNVF